MLILNEEQIKQFNKITRLDADKVFISKNKKYCYATLLTVDQKVKIRISKEIANNFI